jgi:outer membrane biosynthesis protein TonB
MAPQHSTSSTTQARNGRRSVAVIRRRALVAALGLAVLAAVVPVTAAHATPQSPEVDTHLTNPGGNPQPPTPPEPPQPPLPGPDNVVNPTENPEPPLPPEPPDNGPDDLVNPTENPEPPTPPVDNPTPSVDDSVPTPQRIDAGFGGTAAGSHQAAGVALIGAAILLALLVVVLARRRRSETGSTR